jgi:hypothetical protein
MCRVYRLRPEDELTVERIEMDALVCRIPARLSSTEPRPNSPDSGSDTLVSDAHLPRQLAVRRTSQQAIWEVQPL